jgi:hypothetical protein
MTDSQFAEVVDLVATDIKINLFDFGKRTSLAEEVEIARMCFVAMGRGNVA